MKTSWMLLSLCVGFPAVATTAASTSMPALETKGFVYESRIADKFQVYLDSLSQGYPVGKVTETAKAGSNQASMAEIGTALQQSIEQMRKDAEKDREELLKRIRAFPHSDEALSPDKSAPKPVGEVQFSAFVACAARTVPQLKSMRRAELRNDETSLSFFSQSVDGERGNGKEVSVGGIPCGVYLGPWGTSSEGTRNDIKWLSCFALASSKPTQEALLSYWLLRHRAKAGEADTIWGSVWKYACLNTVLSPDKTPDAQKLLEASLKQVKSEDGKLVDSGKEKVTVKAKLSVDEILAALEKQRQAALTDAAPIMAKGAEPK